jgi:hypothetical protein
MDLCSTQEAGEAVSSGGQELSQGSNAFSVVASSLQVQVASSSPYAAWGKGGSKSQSNAKCSQRNSNLLMSGLARTDTEQGCRLHQRACMHLCTCPILGMLPCWAGSRAHTVRRTA